VTEVMMRRARSKICICNAAVCVAAVSLKVCGGEGGAFEVLLGFLKIVMAPSDTFGIISHLRSRDVCF
jgi:hypothetical protein